MKSREVIFVLFLALSRAWTDEHCSHNTSIYLYFSNKTPYDSVRGDASAIVECQPIQTWLLSRHGSRNGATLEMNMMKGTIDLHSKILQQTDLSLCESDKKALENWIWDETVESRSGELNEQGKKDMINLSRRLKKVYPGLFTDKTEDYYFAHTLVPRAIDSCLAFTEGLFGEGVNVIHHSMVEETNALTYFAQRNCKSWLKDDNLVDPIERADAYSKTDEFEELRKGVSERLGVYLTTDNVESMYKTCVYEKSRNINDNSPWCAVFTESDMKKLEYQEDIFMYYMSGHGSPILPVLGHHLLKNLSQTFAKTVEDGGTIENPKVVALFGHDVMLDMIFAAMDYIKDTEPLNPSEPESQRAERHYRSSFYLPFGANLVAVLYKCDGEEQKYKVQLLLNEKPWSISGCPGGVCDWNTFENLISFTKDTDINCTPDG